MYTGISIYSRNISNLKNVTHNTIVDAAIEDKLKEERSVKMHSHIQSRQKFFLFSFQIKM